MATFFHRCTSSYTNCWVIGDLNVGTFCYRKHGVKSVQIRSFLWSIFSHIWTEYEEIRSIFPYSVQKRENTDQKKLHIWALFTQWRSQIIIFVRALALAFVYHIYSNWQNMIQAVERIIIRSSRLQKFLKIGVLKNFANFTGKNLCWGLFLIKLLAFKPATLLKRNSKTDVFR